MKASPEVVGYSHGPKENELEASLEAKGIGLGEVEITILPAFDGPFAFRKARSEDADVTYERWFALPFEDSFDGGEFTLDDLMRNLNNPDAHYETIVFEGKDVSLETSFYDGTRASIETDGENPGGYRRLAEFLFSRTGHGADLDALELSPENEGLAASREWRYGAAMTDAIKESGFSSKEIFSHLADYLLGESRNARNTYANKLRINTLLSRGMIFNHEYLTSPQLVDETIEAVAASIDLPLSQYVSFIMAFRGNGEWDEAARQYNAKLGRQAGMQTVRDHAVRASASIVGVLSNKALSEDIGSHAYASIQALEQSYRKTLSQKS